MKKNKKCEFCENKLKTKKEKLFGVCEKCKQNIRNNYGNKK